MSCFLQIFKAQYIFEINPVEVGDYNNSTNQDPPIPEMTSKGDFLTLKKCQGKLVSVRLNKKQQYNKLSLNSFPNFQNNIVYLKELISFPCYIIGACLSNIRIS